MPEVKGNVCYVLLRKIFLNLFFEMLSTFIYYFHFFLKRETIKNLKSKFNEAIKFKTSPV